MRQKLLTLLLTIMASTAFGANDTLKLSVWANEAIVSAYSYNYNNLIARQKETARYFTSNAWIKYSQAQLKSGLMNSVKKNYYNVSAVATMPPTVKDKGTVQGQQTWEITMPILAVYKNPQYQQKQYLSVTLMVIKQATGERGLAITQFISKQLQAPKCDPDNSTPTDTTKTNTKAAAKK